jgi:hypothetical protein
VEVLFTVKDTPGTMVADRVPAMFGGLVRKIVELADMVGQLIAPLVAIDPLVVRTKFK